MYVSMREQKKEKAITIMREDEEQSFCKKVCAGKLN